MIPNAGFESILWVNKSVLEYLLLVQFITHVLFQFVRLNCQFYHAPLAMQERESNNNLTITKPLVKRSLVGTSHYIYGKSKCSVTC